VRAAKIFPVVVEISTQNHISITCSHVAGIFRPLPHEGHPLGNVRDSSHGEVPYRGSHGILTSRTYVEDFGRVIYPHLQFVYANIGK
jgi:hypothetical protein